MGEGVDVDVNVDDGGVNMLLQLWLHYHNPGRALSTQRRV